MLTRCTALSAPKSVCSRLQIGGAISKRCFSANLLQINSNSTATTSHHNPLTCSCCRRSLSQFNTPQAAPKFNNKHSTGNASAILKAFSLTKSDHMSSIELNQTAHPKYGHVKIIAQLGSMEPDDEFDQHDEELDSEALDPQADSSVSDLDEDQDSSMSNRTLLSMQIGLQCEGKSFVIKCEGPVVNDIASEAEKVEEMERAGENAEGNELSGDLEGDEFGSKGEAFAPISIRVSANGEDMAKDFDDKSICLYPEDLNDKQNEKLETVLEEVGITSETVDEIVDILIQHEESLVADQKKHVTTLLGN